VQLCVVQLAFQVSYAKDKSFETFTNFRATLRLVQACGLWPLTNCIEMSPYDL